MPDDRVRSGDRPARGPAARFDLLAVARDFPAEAGTLLLDHRLTDEPAASARVFRVYRPTPPHWHEGCDEYLHVLTGQGTFWAEGPEHEAPFGPGHLLFFRRGVVHAIPRLEPGEPVVFFSVDTPRRDPGDIHFVDPASGTPASFIRPASS